VIDRLHAATMKALAHPKTREIYAASAAEPGSMSPTELQAYVAREIKDWAEVVRATGLKVD
jgi:tripartite-type tricarboxylate transporter receptor subunit TctC